MQPRRQMLVQCGQGAGLLALADLMSRESLAQESAQRLSNQGARDGKTKQPASSAHHSLTARSSAFPVKAKNIIWLFMHGGPSQVDTFDENPMLAKFDGQPPGLRPLRRIRAWNVHRV
jgi:hypothetical protein